MRSDIFTDEVVRKCSSLKTAGLWPAEPAMRPRAWLRNFEPADQPIAAVLLDRFTFFNHAMTDRLLLASFNELGDGVPKGPAAPGTQELVDALETAVFTRVDAEVARPTDSGYTFCRAARQKLGVPDERFVDPADALMRALSGQPVVFLDDIIGSGDQFLTTWTRAYLAQAPCSFAAAHKLAPFTAIYVCLVASREGLSAVHAGAPEVAISVAHRLDERSTVYAIDSHPTLIVPGLRQKVDAFLWKYSPRLTPADEYIARSPEFKTYGYKRRGLLFAFEHSVPDSTLPIYWSDGPDGWTPLRRRT